MIWDTLTDWPMGTILGFFMIVLCLFVLGMIGSGIYSVADRMKGKYVWLAGTVAEKSYTPESSSTGFGVGPSGDGKGMTTVVTSSYEAAKWTMLADVEGIDELEAVSVTPAEYKRIKPGTKIKLRYTRGGLSGKLHGPDEYELRGQ